MAKNIFFEKKFLWISLRSSRKFWRWGIKHFSGIYCAFQKHADSWKFKAQPTNAFFATVNQMFGGSSHAACDCCRARGIQMVVHSSDNETVLGSSRKLRGAAEHLIDGAKNALVGRSLNFRVHMLLKSAVISSVCRSVCFVVSTRGVHVENCRKKLACGLTRAATLPINSNQLLLKLLTP